jgi:hypothetical protein
MSVTAAGQAEDESTRGRAARGHLDTLSAARGAAVAATATRRSSSRLKIKKKNKDWAVSSGADS